VEGLSTTSSTPWWRGRHRRRPDHHRQRPQPRGRLHPQGCFADESVNPGGSLLAALAPTLVAAAAFALL
jgi:hypothetical protein